MCNMKKAIALIVLLYIGIGCSSTKTYKYVNHNGSKVTYLMENGQVTHIVIKRKIIKKDDKVN